MNLLDVIKETYGMDYPIVTADGFDAAIIGWDDDSGRVVYSKDKMIEVMMKRDGMTEFEAIEYFDYNIAGCIIKGYEGEILTPIYCNDRLL